MSEPFIGEIKIFAFDFPPRGYAHCDGQTLPISQNTALFSLLGTTYGGDGRTDFRIPDMRGRSAIHQGQGPGLTNFSMGELGGNERTTLTVGNLPPHSHAVTLRASSADANDLNPSGTALGFSREDTYVAADPDVNMRSGSVVMGNTGSGQGFSNRSPYLTMNWCIALTGVFPSRS